jgi:exopolysaccharide production protein ExoQ
MKSLIAAMCAGVGILSLCLLDSNKRSGFSNAIWIPFLWLLIGSSRPVTAWFVNLQTGSNYEDGSPLDRTILTILLSLALFVLSKRMQRVKSILRANLPIILFFLYCLASMVWSDFPLVTFKRWIRGAADVVMILVIITEPSLQDALKWLLTRVAFLLIPLSVLMIRFFPQYGRGYTVSGTQMWTGVCTDKNGLGAICMIFGTALLWKMLIVSSTTKLKRFSNRELISKGTVFALTLYLISIIDSKTALTCFLLANTLIVLTWLSRWFRKPTILTVTVAGMIISCYCVLFLGIGSGALDAMGRQRDLTGRTEIWATVLPLAKNPLLGTGYEDFWMGERLETFSRNLARLNQAHNGYLEIYLNLGWIGLILLGAIIVTGYRNLMRGLRGNLEMGRLKLAFFTICLIYNFTEATFKMQSPVWIFFLWASMAIPKVSARSRTVAEDVQTSHMGIGKYDRTNTFISPDQGPYLEAQVDHLRDCGWETTSSRPTSSPTSSITGRI